MSKDDEIDEQIEEAAARYAEFHGQDAESIECEEISEVSFLVGEVCAIEYKIIDENGKSVFYRHDFETPPALSVTSDGDQAIILSGEWSFTERGFEG
jgi:hypothetical protein